MSLKVEPLRTSRNWKAVVSICLICMFPKECAASYHFSIPVFYDLARLSSNTSQAIGSTFPGHAARKWAILNQYKCLDNCSVCRCSGISITVDYPGIAGLGIGRLPCPMLEPTASTIIQRRILDVKNWWLDANYGQNYVVRAANS